MTGLRGWAVVAVALASLPLTGCGSPGNDCDSLVPTPTIDPAAGYHSTFPPDAVDYFVEIAFGAEYGSGNNEIHRWADDVKIDVHGDPSRADLATLCQVVADINGLSRSVEVSIVESGQNVDLYFVPESQFSSIEPNYVPGNVGFFWTWWDDSGNLSQARVLVSTSDDVDQGHRNHIIREEVTQVLGLMQDSYDYADSIFYQPWSDVQDYSDLDEMVIEMLYLPAITSGMTVNEALAVIPHW